MGITHHEHVPATPERVWAHMTRPGAMRRLMPAWQPLTPVQETPSLDDGDAVLGLPGPFTWVSRHQPQGYRPGAQFVDRVQADGWRSWPAARIRWQHTHHFEAAADGGTVVTDSVDTPVPARALRPMFRWRGDQLRSDLAAADRLLTGRAPQRPVAITGTSGMVGSALAALLGVWGLEVVRLVRGPAGPGERTWDPENPDPRLLDGIGAVIHLAGAPIAGRFTPAHRRAVRESRVGPTRRLAAVAAEAHDGPEVFVSASAIGFYGAQRSGESLVESDSGGSDFLAEVVREWEEATEPAASAGLRTVQVRTGIALSAAGGVLRLMRPLYSLGLGGRLGSGTQVMSWIDLDDLLDVYARALLDDRITGPVNAVSPQSVDAATFARTLGRVLHRPAAVPVPALGPRLLLGHQGAEELALADQDVRPHRLEVWGHEFRRPDLTRALAHHLGRVA